MSEHLCEPDVTLAWDCFDFCSRAKSAAKITDRSAFDKQAPDGHLQRGESESFRTT